MRISIVWSVFMLFVSLHCYQYLCILNLHLGNGNTIWYWHKLHMEFQVNTTVPIKFCKLQISLMKKLYIFCSNWNYFFLICFYWFQTTSNFQYQHTKNRWIFSQDLKFHNLHTYFNLRICPSILRLASHPTSNTCSRITKSH